MGVHQEKEFSFRFGWYFDDAPLMDRYANDPTEAVDVIVPVIHTNEVWRRNLLSIYREIPVNRLLIGDGGCIDDSIDIARQFPRVEVFNHREFVSLGYSIAKLVEEVQTEWFVYVHSDVYIPEGWFEAMAGHRGQYDWFECRQHITVMAHYPLEYDAPGMDRPFSGSQMGRAEAVKQAARRIDDDYLYRNEDIILAYLTEQAGFRYGRVDEAYHYHQVMPKQSKWRRGIKNVIIEIDPSREEHIRAWTMQVRGIIKYMQPTAQRVGWVKGGLGQLAEYDALQMSEFIDWVRVTNPAWLGHLVDEKIGTVVIPPPANAPVLEGRSMWRRALDFLNAPRERQPFRRRLRDFLIAARNLVLG